jgi:hypothetical protein
VATELSRDQLQRLARLGAQSRLAELRKEEAAIRAAFPDLFRGAGAKRARGAAAAPKKRTRKRRKMSAAEKRAVSERMKKYWADRRKAR